MCILKLCGVLGIGPYPYNPMNFDLVAYSNAIDIAMEKCRVQKFDRPEKEKRKLLAKKVKAQLEKSMKTMRELHLIHGDIKP